MPPVDGRSNASDVARMRLSLTQRVPASAAVTWRYLTDPELMNRWSRARIELVDLGDEERPDTPGALRRVHVPAGLFGERTLLEAVQIAEAPRRFVYRVVPDPWVRSHRGEIAFGEDAGSTIVTWNVEVELAVGGPLIGHTLERELRSSLETLARVARPVEPVPPSRPVYDEPDAELWKRAGEILALQQAMADQMEQRDDPRRWFARVYQYVTENQIAAARGRSVIHVAWVLRLIPRFHAYYADNLERREARRRCERQWEVAFDAMEGKIGKRRGEESFRIGYGLLRGVRAHIEDDLPRALADVYFEHYRTKCDFVRFRGDYLSMGPIFDDATRRLVARMPRSMTPWYASMLPRPLEDEWRRRSFYDVGSARLKAFERGGQLARLLARHLDRTQRQV